MPTTVYQQPHISDGQSLSAPLRSFQCDYHAHYTVSTGIIVPSVKTNLQLLLKKKLTWILQFVVDLLILSAFPGQLVLDHLHAVCNDALLLLPGCFKIYEHCVKFQTYVFFDRIHVRGMNGSPVSGKLFNQLRTAGWN